MSGPHLLTVAEAAATLRCSTRQVWKLIAKGVLSRGPQYGLKAVVHAESVFQALEKTYDPAPVDTFEPAPKKRRRPPKGSLAAECAAMRERVRRGG